MTSAAASTAGKPSKFQVPRQPEEMTVRQAKPLLHRSTGISSYVDHLTGDNRFESVTRESSLGKCCTLRELESKTVGFTNILGLFIITESETAFSTFPSVSANREMMQDNHFGAGSSDETKSLINRGNSNESSGNGCGPAS